jgi:hypothetical protein
MYRKNSILESVRKNPPPVDKNRGLETTLLIPHPETTVIYTHVVSKNVLDVRSPLDQ